MNDENPTIWMAIKPQATDAQLASVSLESKMDHVRRVSFPEPFQTESVPPYPMQIPLSPPSKRELLTRLAVAVSVASFFNLSYGAIVGYPAPALPYLNAHRSPFHLSDDEQSWVGSLIALGATVAGPVSGTVNDLLGRKVAMMASSLFIIVGLTVVAASTSAHFMYAGIFLSSFFAMINAAAAVLYTAEVSPAQVRGTLMSLNPLAYSIGMVIIYGVGAVVPWNWLAVFCAVLYAIPNIVLAFLPESPRWFILRGNREAAIHGLQWFQGGDDAEGNAEMRAIEQSLQESSSKSGWSSWLDLVAVGEHRKSLAICCSLFILQGFNGIVPMQMFTVTIFQAAGGSATALDPNLQTVISGLCSCVGSVLCPLLVDRIGRKTLLLASAIVLCLSMGLTGAFFQVLVTSPDYAHRQLFWLPLLGLSLGNCAFAAGLFPVPYILTSEMFPTNTRGNAQAVALVCQGLSGFACVKTFIDIQAGIGTSGAFFVYTGVCAATALIVTFAVKEPKLVAMK